MPKIVLQTIVYNIEKITFSFDKYFLCINAAGTAFIWLNQ